MGTGARALRNRVLPPIVNENCKIQRAPAFTPASNFPASERPGYAGRLRRLFFVTRRTVARVKCACCRFRVAAERKLLNVDTFERAIVRARGNPVAEKSPSFVLRVAPRRKFKVDRAYTTLDISLLISNAYFIRLYNLAR